VNHSPLPPTIICDEISVCSFQLLMDIACMRYCKCPDALCLDMNVQCSGCDKDGYPVNARRRLKRSGDKLWKDIDNPDHVFRAKKTKTGDRLVPVFNEKGNWSSVRGYASMMLILSCLGAEDEYVLWDDASNSPMTEDEWLRKKFTKRSFPCIWHTVCDEKVTSTLISNLQQGHCIGCRCKNSKLNHWRERRDEVVEMGMRNNFRVETTEGEREEKGHGHSWCPTVTCLNCNDEVTTTSIANLQQRGGIGCRCKSNQLKHWRERRDEVVEKGRENNFRVETTEEEWREKCHGAYWCPTVTCLNCEVEVTTTSINSLQQGGGIGCACRNKTETKLHMWLTDRFPDADVKRQYSGPGRTHFDFHVSFQDGFQILVELDGPQHFRVDHKFFTDEGCERDMEKEKWAAEKGMCVVRVLQKDVWEDVYGWRDWLIKAIEKEARSGIARPLTPPDAPEYTSSDSTYVKMRI